MGLTISAIAAKDDAIIQSDKNYQFQSFTLFWMVKSYEIIISFLHHWFLL